MEVGRTQNPADWQDTLATISDACTCRGPRSTAGGLLTRRIAEHVSAHAQESTIQIMQCVACCSACSSAGKVQLGVANRVCGVFGLLPALHVVAGDGFEVHIWCAWQALRLLLVYLACILLPSISIYVLDCIPALWQRCEGVGPVQGASSPALAEALFSGRLWCVLYCGRVWALTDYRQLCMCPIRL